MRHKRFSKEIEKADVIVRINRGIELTDVYPDDLGTRTDILYTTLIESPVSSKSKREYLEAIYLRYRRASRKKKAVILDEFCAACKYHRKHAIRLLRKFTRFIKPKKEERQNASL